MDKIKRYVECYIDTETCNFRCHYCYIALTNKFNKKLVKFTHTPEEMRKALSKERLGGVCLFNLCAGGETLLSSDVVPVIKALLEEGHYVMVVTNGSMTNRLKEISNFDKNLLERLIFKFSFHYLELKRLNMMDKFFENIKMMRDAGCSFTLEITPNDEIIPEIDNIIKISEEKLGAKCHCTIARDDRKKNIDVLSKYDFDEYKKIWSKLDSNLFDFKKEIFYKKRKEFCYAGDWSIYVNLSNGDVKQCYAGRIIDNIYEDINRPIKFEAIGSNCPQPHCYNGHAFLALGDIPELETPTYASLRNRVCSDGSEWLNPKMKAFMSQKLYDNNDVYDDKRKKNVNRTYKIKNFSGKSKFLVRKVVRKINDKKSSEKGL